MTRKQFIQNLGFLYSKPQVMWRTLKNYGYLIRGIRRLRSIDLDLTYECPCHCVQCYSDKFKTNDLKLLDHGEIQILVQQAIELGAIQVNLTGGEPLVRKGITEIISLCQPKRMIISICSSGVGLTPKRIRSLKQAGLSLLILSLDHVDSEVHDNNRGIPGLYKRIMHTVKACKHLGLNVMFNTVATKEKMIDGSMESLIKLSNELDVILNLTVPIPMGRWSDDLKILLDEEDKTRFFSYLQRSGVRSDTMSTYLNTGCPAGIEKITISAGGDVKPCTVIPISFGNIRYTSLEEIWIKMLEKPDYYNIQPFCIAGDKKFLEENRKHYLS